VLGVKWTREIWVLWRNDRGTIRVNAIETVQEKPGQESRKLRKGANGKIVGGRGRVGKRHGIKRD